MFSLIVAFLFAARAHAQSTTEFFHQPAGGAFEATPHVGYRTMTTHSKTGGTPDINTTGLQRAGAKFAYGLNPLVALDVDVAYSTYTVSNGGGDSKGLEPLQVSLDAMLPMEMGTLQYGIGTSFGLEKAKIDGSGNINRSFGDIDSIPAGAFKVAPYLGYAFHLGSAGELGLRASYDVVSSDSKVSSPYSQADLTFSGGNAGHVAVFYEGKATDITLGAALTYDFYKKAEIDPSAGAVYNDADHNLIGGRFYAAMPLGGGTDFLPSIVWRENAKNDYLDRTSDIVLNIAGRFTF